MRVSDEDIDEVRGGVDEVKSGRGDAFMLFYERMDGTELGSASLGVKGKGREHGRVLRSVRLGMADSSEASGSTIASGASAPSTSSPPCSPPGPVEATLPVGTPGLGEESDAPVIELEAEEPNLDAQLSPVEPETVKKRKTKKKKKKGPVAAADNEGAG